MGSAEFSLPIYRAAGPALSTNPAYYGPASLSLPPPMAIPSPDTPQFPRGTLPDGQEPREGTWDLAQREWRTPPLWGVASTAPYLHDGRAATTQLSVDVAVAGFVPAGMEVSNAAEPDTRYEVLLGTFQAMRLVDEYSPTAPPLIERRHRARS